MKLRKVLYDTSVYSGYKRFLDQRPDPDYTSLVVYQERIVSVNTGRC